MIHRLTHNFSRSNECRHNRQSEADFRHRGRHLEKNR